jgi:DNA-binding XRE family transcriptional regulator
MGGQQKQKNLASAAARAEKSVKTGQGGKTVKPVKTSRRSGDARAGSGRETGAVPWREVKAKARRIDPTWDTPDRAAHRARIRDDMLAAVSGAQLAYLRRQARLTQAQLAAATGLTQARISQIEHGQAVSLDVLRAYITGLGGHVEITARIGTTTLNIA